jgi:hypothetical protein
MVNKHFPRIDPRKCNSCGSRAWLCRICPTPECGELRNYECSECARINIYEVSPEPLQIWTLLEAASWLDEAAHAK